MLIVATNGVKPNLASNSDSLLSNLAPNVILPFRPKGYRETFALYMCTAKKRDHLLMRFAIIPLLGQPMMKL